MPWLLIRLKSWQTNESSREIGETTQVLMEDSAKAVENMQQMQQILQNQSESMQATQNIVEEVLSGIRSSMSGIGQIKTSTKRLDDSRSEVVEAVSALSEIAGNNVEGTKKTYDETEAVAGTFKQVYESAEQLRQIAEQLVGEQIPPNSLYRALIILKCKKEIEFHTAMC